MTKALRATSLFLGLSAVSCVQIFSTEHVPTARDGTPFTIDLAFINAFGQSQDEPIVCFEFPSGWQVDSPEYAAVLDGLGTTITGTGASDSVSASQLANDTRAGHSWHCFLGPDASYDENARGQARLTVTATGAGTYEIRFTSAGRELGIGQGTIFSRRVVIEGVSHFMDDWRPSSSPFQYGPIESVRWLDGAFQMIADDRLLRSTDGVTFVEANMVGSARDVAFGAGKWVVVGTNFIAGATSTSAFTVEDSERVAWRGVVFGNGRFVTVGLGGGIRSSSGDGTWIDASVPIGDGFRAVAFGDGKFVAVTTAAQIYTSTTGLSFNEVLNRPSVTEAVLSDVAYGDGEFVAVGSGLIWRSADAESWVAEASPTMATFEGVGFGNGTWAALADQFVFTSTGGAWVQRHPGHAPGYRDIAFGADTFVVTNEVGAVSRLQTPRVSTAPTVDFGQIRLDDPPRTREVLVASDGPGRLSLGTAEVTGDGYTLIDDGCAFSLASPGTSCVANVSFTPTVTGTIAGQLAIESNDPARTTVNIPMRVFVRPERRPEINVSDAIPPADDQDLPFGEVDIGALRERPVMIQNLGEAPLTLGVIDPGMLSAPFALDPGPCSEATIPVNRQCTVNVTFAPTDPGDFSGSFTFTSDDLDEPVITVSMSGNAVAPPQRSQAQIEDSIEPSFDRRLRFDSVSVGMSAQGTVTVTNLGEADLVFSEIILDGDVEAFALTDPGCQSATVAASASCNLGFSFTPSREAELEVRATFATNDPDNSRVRIVLNGNGVVVPDNAGNRPPSSPKLVTPDNGKSGVSRSPTLGWEDSIDPDGDEVTYAVRLCTNAELTGCERMMASAWLSPGSDRFTGTATSFGILCTSIFGLFMLLAFGTRQAPRVGRKLAFAVLAAAMLALSACPSPGANTFDATNLDPGTTYFWQVIAMDGRGGEAGSEIWRFTTKE